MAGDLNVNQLTVATTVVDADKLYYGKSPFGVTDDRAISYLNFKTQINITDTYSGLNTTDKTIVGALNEAYQWDRALLSGSVYYLTPRHSGDVLKLKNYIYLGTVDPYSRTQIWNYELNSVLRLGALTSDGDPVDATSEGSVFYGQNAQVDAMSNVNFSYVRLKPTRIGLYNGKSGGYTGYLFRLDTQTDECYLRDNAGTKVFDFVRATGSLTLSALSLAGGIVQTNAAGLLSTSVTLPNGTLATTQAAGDNSTKLATTAYVDNAVSPENLWDRTVIPAFYTVVTPHTATDRIQVPTITGGGTYGGILYTDMDGNKTITASSNMVWTGAGFLLGSSSPYLKIYQNAGVALAGSGFILQTSDNDYAGIYHAADATAASNSTLDFDAKPSTASEASLMRFGYNTVAATTSFVFYNGKASYAAHPTFSADTELVDKKYVDEAILGEDLWDRVSIDGGLFKITPKDSTDMLDIPKSIHSASTLVIQGHISSNYIAQFNALSGNAQIGLRQSASTPNVKIGHIYQRYTADNWFVGLNTTNEDFLFIRDPSGSAGISLSLNATTGAATFLSNIVTTSGNIYIGTPSDNTVGSWAQLKTGTGLSTTYKIQHYEDVSGDGSAYGYVSKFVVDYSGNAAIYATDGGPLYGTLTVGTVSLIKKNADPHLLIYATAGKSVIHIDQHSATRAYSGIKYSRNGTENWFAGLNTADDHYRIWRGGLNAFALQTNGTLHLNASVASSFGGLTILNSGSSGYPSITLWNGSVGATNSWNIICFDGKLQFQYFDGTIWVNKEIWTPT